MRKSLCTVAVIGLVALLGVSSQAQSQAKVKVLSDGPLQPALVPIAEAFRRDRGHSVEYVFGPSPAVHKKVADGEIADVLIIDPLLNNAY